MLNAYQGLSQLLLYRNILNDKIVKELITIGDSAFSGEWGLAGRFIDKAEELGLSGNLVQGYVSYLVSTDNNVFTSTAEKNNGQVGEGLAKAAAHDVAILRNVLRESGEPFELLANYQPTFPRISPCIAEVGRYLTDEAYVPEEAVRLLCQYYARYGYGVLASGKAFGWDRLKGLVAVENADTIEFEDIVGYEKQKQALMCNTEAFLAGKPAHNVLLVGARGTGKSSSVKALVNRYERLGLRLIEVKKKDLECLPDIMAGARQWGKKFILFLDDLSFEDTEHDYKGLKSVIDGGLEAKPDNVLIYATSNRRHLIRESWQDRVGEELHQQDTVNEKISLSDRFGITLTYLSPTQEEYLAIVETIARKKQLAVSACELRQKALRWEMSHSGRSGRLAKQFIDDLLGKASNA